MRRSMLDDIIGRPITLPTLAEPYRTGVTIKRERSRCTRDQQRAVRNAVRKKILEGELSHVTIYEELISEGVIANNLDHPTAPRLGSVSIHRYVKSEREALEIELPFKYKKVLQLYEADAYKYRRNPMALYNRIANECGTTSGHVCRILADHNKIKRRSYVKRTYTS